jgi:hypothetical protein
MRRRTLEALATAGRQSCASAWRTYHPGAEMFRWEIATAVAGSIIGVNPPASRMSKPAIWPPHRRL